MKTYLYKDLDTNSNESFISNIKKPGNSPHVHQHVNA